MFALCWFYFSITRTKKIQKKKKDPGPTWNSTRPWAKIFGLGRVPPWKYHFRFRVDEKPTWLNKSSALKRNKPNNGKVSWFVRDALAYCSLIMESLVDMGHWATRFADLLMGLNGNRLELWPWNASNYRMLQEYW